MGKIVNKKKKISSLMRRKISRKNWLKKTDRWSEAFERKEHSNESSSTCEEPSKQYITLSTVAADVPTSQQLNELLPYTDIDACAEEMEETTVLQNMSHDDGAIQVDIGSDSGLPYLVEEEVEEEHESILGRRIVDVKYFWNELKRISSHQSLFDCSFENLIIVGENRKGLFSTFNVSCNLCGLQFKIQSENKESTDNLNINDAAVSGIIATGIGFTQFQELASAMDVPVFSEKYYQQIQNKVFDDWEKTAVDCMEAAAAREKEAAILEGRVKNGIPLIDVLVDGCWCARSYGDNYRALSGAAVIIGRKFGEVLYVGVKNKYCLICARAQNKENTPKDHLCYKNFEGSSSSMESEIICEAFKQSIDMYGIIYARVIADGDSSTYTKILNANPYTMYNHIVEKIECRNHVLRNLCKKLRAIPKDLKYPLAHRKLVTDVRIMSIRKVTVASIKHNKLQEHKPDAIRQLHDDILNSILHAFGDHRKCKTYYCNKDHTLTSSIAAELENTPMWFRIRVIMSNVASKSRSLVEDVDTNTVERFNSVIAKLVGGKRINFALRRSYQSRCSAAVVAFNSKMPLYTLHKNILGQSPKSNIKKMEQRRITKRKMTSLAPRKKNRQLRLQKKQHDYGSCSSAPDMPLSDFELAKDRFLKNLEDLTADRDTVERSTVLQRDCSEWLELRKNLLTASNFGQVIKRKKKKVANLVKNILYKANISSIASVAHGIENEKIALEQLAKQENVRIEPCGLFVHKKYPFIGASPDGLIGNDCVVEIKCPVAAYKIGMEAAIKSNKVQLYKYDKKKDQVVVNKNSNWYFQAQGQLHVSDRKTCVFGIWAGESVKLEVIRIERDEDFWNNKMEKKLVDFYINSMLPELVDPRHTRGLPLREYDDDQCCKENINLQSPSRSPDTTPLPATSNTEQMQLDFWDY